MLRLSTKQYEALTADAERRFNEALVRRAHDDFAGIYRWRDVSSTAEAIRPLVDRAHVQYGFRGERDCAAFVLAALAVGEEALLATPAFLSAVDNPALSVAAKAEALVAAVEQARPGAG